MHEANISFDCTKCGADSADDATTVNTNEKKVEDPALEPEVAGKESLDCKQCGERFNQKADLKNHMSSTHKANISFEDTKGGADSANDATTVDSNEKKVEDPALEPKVAGGKRLNCELCDKQFHRKTKLKKHMSSFHG